VLDLNPLLNKPRSKENKEILDELLHPFFQKGSYFDDHINLGAADEEYIKALIRNGDLEL
jgi:hypothetical protein